LGKDYLLKHVTEGKVDGLEDEEEDGSSYWMNVRKREVTGTLRGRSSSYCVKNAR